MGISEANLTILLYEVVLYADKEGKAALGLLKNNPAFFPFQLPALTGDYISQQSNTIDVIRYGLDDELLKLKDLYKRDENRMPWPSEHIKWLVDTGKRLKTADGKDVEIWELRHEQDDAVLSAWAKHFRNHYCLDTDIDRMRGKQTRKDYLNTFKFPCCSTKLGPGIRAGDFGEILVADYLQWLLGYWVPRVRWGSKVIRDESPKGSDVIGFRFHKKDCSTSPEDVLIVFETKTKFSGSGKNRLQDAINDSAKDHLRMGESLHFIKQQLCDKENITQAELIARFQNPVDFPYKESFGAAAIISDEHFDTNVIVSSDCGKIPKSQKSKEHIPHPNGDSLILLVIKGPSMMDLVHELYRRAADEA